MLPGSEHRGKEWGVARLTRAALLIVFTAVIWLSAGPADARRYASIVIDADTGKVLHEAHADRSVYPASLTKMMTLFLTFEALEAGRLSPKMPLKVSRSASRRSPSKLALRAGQRIAVENAILGVVTKSANDAATVLAEALAGTEAKFARKMTEKARALGMTRTTFRNASGLPNRRQKTTARDMAILAHALIRDFPQYYHYFATRSFKYNGNTFLNHNRLLRTYPGADGIKTGYIAASGFNVVASAQRNGRRLIGVVMGARTARSRNAHMAKLLDTAFLGRIALYAALAPKPIHSLARIGLDAARMPKPNIGRDGTVVPARDSLAAAAPSPPAELRWGIQVGAFSQRAAAHQAATRAARLAPKLLADATLAVVAVEEEGATIYRARLLGLSERRARNACAKLAAQDLRCVPVPPQDRIEVALADRQDTADP